MAMLAMAFAFTSCGSDDDDKVDGGGSSAEAVRKVYIFDNGCQYLNRQYKLTVGTDTKILKVDELKMESAAHNSVESKAAAEVNKAKNKGNTVNIYSYEIPATMHGDATLKSDFSVKDGVELPENVDVLIGAYICIGDVQYATVHGNVFYMGGLDKSRVQEYVERRNGLNLGSCTLK